MKTVKVAFVGAGYMAREHIKAFSALPDVELAGLFSRGRARADKLASDYPIRLYSSIAELYEKSRSDIVVVSVNELSVRNVLKEVFEFPWLVLVEKPAGYNLSDAAEIVHQAKRKSRSVFVGLNRRSYSSTRRAQEMLATVEGPRFIKVQDQEDMRAAANDDKKPQLVVDNWMYANAIHLIDYFRIFGRGSVSSITPVVSWNAKKPGLVIAKIEFTSGDLGLYEAVWNGPAPWAVTVLTPQDRFEMRPLEQLGVQKHGTRQTIVIPSDDVDRTYKPGLYVQAQKMIMAARGQAVDLATVDDALLTMKLVADLYQLSE